MVHPLGKILNNLAIAAAMLGLLSLSAYAQEDPPDRVARLNYINGNVSMEPAGLDDWTPATVNRPFTTGDYLYTDSSGMAELHVDDAVMRMGANTSFGFLNLNDQTVQIKLSEGDMEFRVHDLGPNQVFEVDTANAAVTLLRDGVYRFRVDPNGNFSYVVVRSGQAQATGGGQAFTMNTGDSAQITGTDQMSYDVETAPAPDQFDNWCASRDQHEQHLASARYVPPTMIGYEDLDDYGSWQQAPDYGPVWYPRSVSSDWAPYHDGHWAWVEPWGWTWVDDMPWGFAPFHYGRWAYIGNRWGWSPGPVGGGGYGGIRPYYAPAMVAWFGGSNWGVSIGIGGGGPSLGWVPLSYGEVYTPPYACSRSYFSNVNQYNTRVVNTVNITNVYNTVYVNHQVYNQQIANVRAPNAVMSMPQSAFASGRPVRQAAAPVRQADFNRIRTAAVIAPPVAPTRQAVAPTLGRTAARPAAQVIQRPVIAKSTPAAAPAPFAARQAYLQQHAGQPHNFTAMHQAVAPQARQTVAQVRQVPSVRPVAVKPGQRGGNAPPPAVNAKQMPQGQNPASGRVAPGNQAPVSNARPAGQPQAPAPVSHGTPPNLRQAPQNQAPQNQAPQNARSTERTPAPPNRPQAEPASRMPERGQPPATPGAERTQPRTEPPAQTRSEERPSPTTRPAQPAYPERQPAQPNRAPEARPEERPAPQPSPQREARPAPPPQREAQPEAAPQREARPAPAPQREARPAPPPQREAQPEAAPQREARPAPAPEREARPAPPPEHEARPAPPPKNEERRAPPPKDTKDTKDHGK